MFYDKIKEAQQEIKSSVTVNTSNITNREENKDGIKEVEKAKRKRRVVNGQMNLSDESREEWDAAALATSNAYSLVRGGSGSSAGSSSDDNGGPMIPLTPGLEDILAEKVEKSREKEEEKQLSSKISVMQPILR